MKFHAAYFILSLSLLANFVSAQVSAVELKSFAQSKEWRSLLYATESSLFNISEQYQSRSDSKNFFISENGKTDQLSELQASVQAVQSEVPPLNDQSFSCKFPARANYIRKTILKINAIDESGCVKMLAWRERISAESVTLVFSSYYLGNPSSTFGHTLLRINNSGKNKTVRRELLSYGINYGANPWTQNPLLYSVYGLFGLFPGNFIPIPYYYKVREYNDYESRDLWEYDLDLTPDEVSRVVDLLWEQGENFYDYYFLSENCGYYIAALIESAAPRYSIVEPLRKWVIPSDTIGQFQKSGVVKSRKWRPSIYNQFLSRLSRLTSEDEEIVYQLFQMANQQQDQKIAWPESFEKLPPQKQSEILDAALDYYDFIHSKELVNDKSPENKTKSQLLIRRSSLPVGLTLPEKNLDRMAPESAHGSFRWQISRYHAESKANPISSANSIVFGTRFAFHDLEDPLPGYPEGAKIEVMNFKGRYFTDPDMKDRFQFQELKVLDIGSFGDWNRWTNKKSYNVSFGFLRQDLKICDDCWTSNFNFSYGLSKSITTTSESNFRISLLAQAQYMHGDFNLTHHNGWNYFGLGPRLIVQYDPSSDYQFRLEGWHQSLSTAEDALWRSELVLRRNIENTYAIELGASTNEVSNSSFISFYYFTF